MNCCLGQSETIVLSWKTTTTASLEYFGNPIPALQGLDSSQRVIYLGSFSSTLFAAIKISFMVLPEELFPYFNAIKDDYAQTCSKTEQLTLALFMEKRLLSDRAKKSFAGSMRKNGRPWWTFCPPTQTSLPPKPIGN